MKKNVIVMALLTMVAMGVSAQEVSIGIKGGLNIPKITAGGSKSPISEGYSSRMAGAGGVFTELRFTPTFSLVLGLEYSGQGGKNDDMVIPAQQALRPLFANLSNPNGAFAKGLGQLITNFGAGSPESMQLAAFGAALPNLNDGNMKYLYTENTERTAKFHYLMLPVQARFGWNIKSAPCWRIYVQAGVFGSYLMCAKSVTSGTSALYTGTPMTAATKLSTQMAAGINGLAQATVTSEPAFAALNQMLPGMIAGMSATMDNMDFDKTQDITTDLYRFNFGFIGAAGVSYTVATRHSIFFEAGGNYGLVKIQKSDVNGQNRIGAGTVMLGYSFRLSR